MRYVLLLLLSISVHTQALDIPRPALKYRHTLTEQARLVWGLDAPLAIFGAQVQQESNWNTMAYSNMGASGLAQFLPVTAQWIATQDPELDGINTENPTWSLRALARYDYWLYRKLIADTRCDKWAFTLSAYNGGLGWVLKDKNAAQADGANRNRWFNQVERYNSGRSKIAFTENREYPRRILLQLTPLYTKAGWGTGVCNEN